MRSASTVVDVGCGTGVLGLYAALRRSGTTAVLVDVDSNAAKLASKSIRLNRLALNRAESRVNVVCGDGLQWLSSRPRVNLLLCNLPFDPTPAYLFRGAPSPLRCMTLDTTVTAASSETSEGALDRIPGVVLASSSTIGDDNLLRQVLIESGLRFLREHRFWFRTPQRTNATSVNAYSVMLGHP